MIVRRLSNGRVEGGARKEGEATRAEAVPAAGHGLHVAGRGRVCESCTRGALAVRGARRAPPQAWRGARRERGSVSGGGVLRNAQATTGPSSWSKTECGCINRPPRVVAGRVFVVIRSDREGNCLRCTHPVKD
jgi:hypothetical protein